MVQKKSGFRDKFFYPSITTSNFCHSKRNGSSNPEAFAAELLIYRKAIEDGYKLPPYFWRKNVDCPQEYKDAFMQYIECIGKLMKDVQPHFVIQCCIYSKIKFADYGYITAIINKRWDTWKERVANRLINQAEEMFKKEEVVKTVEKESEEAYSNVQKNFENKTATAAKKTEIKF